MSKVSLVFRKYQRYLQ